MPFIHIKSLKPKTETNIGPMLVELCTELANIDGLKPEDVNATFEILPSNYYAHGKSLANQPMPHSHPPLVDLLAWQGRSPETIKKMLSTSAKIIAKHLEISEKNIFINYRESTSGRVFADGNII